MISRSCLLGLVLACSIAGMLPAEARVKTPWMITSAYTSTEQTCHGPYKRVCKKVNTLWVTGQKGHQQRLCRKNLKDRAQLTLLMQPGVLTELFGLKEVDGSQGKFFTGNHDAEEPALCHYVSGTIDKAFADAK